ncbi:uncharacterized protein C9orf40 homolog [Carettochelys insculpta]|uniref:uncharacterized protein C9orf40 homolog n=1 Tax=Carettochelys insculpta TaxID=44489 RepID=UPI003EBF67BD
MAKRHAEPLVCHVPWKRFLPEPPLHAPGHARRPRDEPELWSAERAPPGGPGKKRKLEEAEAPPGKRPGPRACSPCGEPGDPASLGGRRRQQQQQRGGDVGPRQEQAVWGGGVGLGVRSPDPRGEERGTEEHGEEFWQYNSFQYWRAPLPAIDLSFIVALEGENVRESRTTSKTEILETEMET